MSWQIFITISLIAGALATIGEKKVVTTQKLKSETLALLFLLTGSILVFSYIILSNQINILSEITSINYKVSIVIIITSLGYAIGNLSGFKALQTMEASRFSLLMSFKTILVVVIASTFLHESLSIWQILGGLLIFISILIVFKTPGKFTFKKGEQLVILAAIGYATASIAEKLAINETNIYLLILLIWPLTGIFVWAIKFRDIKKDFSNITLKRVTEIIPFTLLFVISSIAFYEALNKNNNAAVIATINNSQVIVTILLSFIFLKETNDWQRKVIAAVMTFGGLVILAG